MKRDNVNYLLVGSFVILVLIAFFVLMYFVTGSTGPADRYTVRYNNVAGLKFGTGVYYEGYHVGQIEEIEPEAASSGMRYVLTLSIARGWKIPADSVAQVVASGLISAVQIHINEGQSPKVIKPGGEISGREQQDLFAVLSEAAGQFHSLSENGVMPVLQNLNNRIDEIAEEILTFRRKQLGPLVASFDQRLNNELLGEAQALVGKLNNSAEQLEKILGSKNQVQIQQFLVHIDQAAVNLNDLITRIESTRQQMGETLVSIENLASNNDEAIGAAVANANQSMVEMREALRTVNEHLGTIMYNVEGGTRNLKEFSQAVRDNPARLIRGSEQQADAP
ncbi:MAG: MlaD family protein [Gammaproteobacteria bacterium]|jgi:phospholipid/cholesterol/gamma-HCH transport system substrate-binding protein